MSTIGSIGPFGPSSRKSGRLLLLGSLLIWAGSVVAMLVLSPAGGVALFATSALGGTASGLLAARRSFQISASCTKGFWAGRIAANLCAAAILMYVLGGLTSSNELAPKWANFALSVFVYSIVRDVVRSMCGAIWDQRESRVRERRKTDQCALVMELLTNPSAVGSGKLYHLPLD